MKKLRPITLRDLRESKGFTQAELAKVLGMDQGKYSLIETGKRRNVPYLVVMQLKQLLGARAVKIIEARMKEV